MPMKHPRHTSPSCTSEKPETANQPKVHKILQGIRQREGVSQSFVFSTFRIDIMQFCTWGERWGSSDYASRAKPGADGSREAQPIYDQQIAFSSSPTSEESATASESVEAQRRQWSRAQNRRSERCSAAKRVEPYRGTTLQKSQSTSTALEFDPRALSVSVSSSEGYAGVSGRKRHRLGKASSPSLSRRHADPTTSNSAAIPVHRRTWPGATSRSLGSNPISFPQGCVAPQDDWIWSSNEAESLAHFQQHNFNSFGPSHATSAGGIAQTGQQISLEASYAAPGGGTPMPGYSHGPSDSIVWPWTYPVVTATRPTLPYNDDPEANQRF